MAPIVNLKSVLIRLFIFDSPLSFPSLLEEGEGGRFLVAVFFRPRIFSRHLQTEYFDQRKDPVVIVVLELVRVALGCQGGVLSGWVFGR